MSQHQDQPAQPKSVLRGHRAQVHVTTFIRGNQRLASGDADGFVILWDLTIMRPRAVWRAHTNSILGISDWDGDKIITHGRDNRLVVWKLGSQDEIAMSTALPLDESVPERPQPWILYILEVNTLNFCSFSCCPPVSDIARDEILVAVPNTLESEAVDIFQLPSQRRQGTANLGNKTEDKGMAMSLRLFRLNECLTLVAAYESGLAVLAQLGRGETWDILYRAQVHSQPVLSLDVDPRKRFFLTSGADSVIAKHPIPTAAIPTKESQGIGQTNGETAALPLEPKSAIPPRQARQRIETQPLKTINTKHSGQQSLRIRSDGKIFATAGWDSKIRVYSTKTMSELAVLKWHEVGCYAVAFAILADTQPLDSLKSNLQNEETEENSENGVANSHILDNRASTRMSTSPKPGQLSVKDRRMKMAKGAHWLAAGSKDGKISLWDIY
ncbi:WD40 repeat-like protein [Annulohypoxylon maeteangense]|uniref:WD40 repeat-like protein n=1 Tax=Annulohypoxylon maeteangense TaxID=1927788 RepID=UPI002008D078|nr:WD40 repeat-like protein [Annulohypoxylon maeteangense]KAI0889520.1 WD40 repeat-like protein [Annulohypoxylon maeteangense]